LLVNKSIVYFHLPHASAGSVVLTEFQCDALQLANITAKPILKGCPRKSRLEKQMTIWHCICQLRSSRKWYLIHNFQFS